MRERSVKQFGGGLAPVVPHDRTLDNIYDAIHYALDAGDKARSLRERAGLSRSELARRLGVTASTVAAFEAGTAVPQSVDLHDLASALCDGGTADGVTADGVIGRSAGRDATRLTDALPIAEELGVGDDLVEVVHAALGARHALHALTALAGVARDLLDLDSLRTHRRTARADEAAASVWVELANLLGWARSAVDHVRRDGGRARVAAGLLPGLPAGRLRDRVEHAFAVLLAGRVTEVLWLTDDGAPVALIPPDDATARRERHGDVLFPMPDPLRGPVTHHGELSFDAGRDALVFAAELVDELGDFVTHVLDAFADSSSLGNERMPRRHELRRASTNP